MKIKKLNIIVCIFVCSGFLASKTAMAQKYDLIQLFLILNAYVAAKGDSNFCADKNPVIEHGDILSVKTDGSLDNLCCLLVMESSVTKKCMGLNESSSYTSSTYPQWFKKDCVHFFNPKRVGVTHICNCKEETDGMNRRIKIQINQENNLTNDIVKQCDLKMSRKQNKHDLSTKKKMNKPMKPRMQKSVHKTAMRR